MIETTRRQSLVFLARAALAAVAMPGAAIAAEPKPKPGGDKPPKDKPPKDKDGGGMKGEKGDHRGGHDRDGRHGRHGRGGIVIDLGGGQSRYGYRCPRGMRWSYRRERCVWDY